MYTSIRRYNRYRLSAIRLAETGNADNDNNNSAATRSMIIYRTTAEFKLKNKYNTSMIVIMLYFARFDVNRTSRRVVKLYNVYAIRVALIPRTPASHDRSIITCSIIIIIRTRYNNITTVTFHVVREFNLDFGFSRLPVYFTTFY